MYSYKYNKIRGKIQTPAAFCPAANQSADTAAGFSCAGQPNAAAGAVSYGLPAADMPCLFVDNPYAGGRHGDFGKRILLLAGKFGGGDCGSDRFRRGCISRTFFVCRDADIGPPG
ncbi:hypothetical protein [Alistipes sp.]|uniref:hypothetical protein n=1 Tax=Alistipes sp. TaxID=1872444 RepID=UPI003AF7A509